MYGFGFYKRFWADKDGPKGKKIKGETHPYSSDIHAANETIDVNLSGKRHLLPRRHYRKKELLHEGR
jgi:hypothetical protein